MAGAPEGCRFPAAGPNLTLGNGKIVHVSRLICILLAMGQIVLELHYLLGLWGYPSDVPLSVPCNVEYQ